MTEKIIIAGAGGQGVMLMGKILAYAAMKENKQVTWLPSYGAEVRGGTAHCMVIISTEQIGSPYIDRADALIIMNEPSWERFKSRVSSQGVLFINRSLVNSGIEGSARVIKHPFTDIAIKLGNIRVANIVALGCFLAKKKIVEIKTVLRSIEEIAPQDKRNLIEINRQALKEGYHIKLNHD